MNNNLTDINVIMDRSGSMYGTADDVIGGFNEFLREQKQNEGDANVSFIMFNTQVSVLHEGEPIDTVPELTRHNYIPNGGTALLDAIGQTIVNTGKRLAAMDEADRPGRVIVLIMTDGEENSSLEYNNETIKQMIQTQENEFSWNFVFMGANQDSFNTAGNYGIKVSSTANYASSPFGTRHAFKALSSNMTKVRGMAPAEAASASFFEPEEQNLDED